MKNNLEIRGLQFGYTKDAPSEIFDGFSYKFAPGKITAITGPSGSGKSTLLYIIAQLLSPGKGEIVYGERVLTSLNDTERSKLRSELFGMVFQDAILDNKRSVLECIIEPEIYAGIGDSNAKEALTKRALMLMEKFKVDIPPERSPLKISGGQASRIALCRALINDPEIILADEPTGNLDHDNAQIALSTFKDLSRDGKTVIIATHDDSVTKSADQVVKL